MKKSELRKIIKECYKEVLKESKGTPVSDRDKKANSSVSKKT